MHHKSRAVCKVLNEKNLLFLLCLVHDKHPLDVYRRTHKLKLFARYVQLIHYSRTNRFSHANVPYMERLKKALNDRIIISRKQHLYSLHALHINSF